MPFFAANNFQIELTLDADPSSTAEADSTASAPTRSYAVVGGTLRGRLQIKCTATTPIRALILRYSVKIGINFDGPPTVMPFHALEIIKPIYSLEIVLVGSRQGQPVDIPPGDYCYPFVVPVPPSVPPTSPACTLSGIHGGPKHMHVGIQHTLSAEVIIAFGVKDYTRGWEVAVMKAVHPQSFATQQLETRFHEAPLYYCATCMPRLPRWFPGLFRVEPHAIQLTVINPLVTLDRQPVMIDTVVRVTKTDRPLKLELCRWAVMRVHESPLTFRLDQIIVSVPLIKYQRFRRTTIGASVTRGDDDEPYDIHVGIPVNLRPAEHSVSYSTPMFSTGYYLVARVARMPIPEVTCCVGATPDEEARVPIVVAHCADDRAPIVHSVMAWLPGSTSTMHAAPEWVSAAGQGLSVRNTSAFRSSTQPPPLPPLPTPIPPSNPRFASVRGEERTEYGQDVEMMQQAPSQEPSFGHPLRPPAATPSMG